MSIIDFKPGEFVALRATTKFHLGALERDLNEGDIIQFDGQIVKIGNAEHNLPVIRGAVKSGWLVPADDTTTRYQPKSAGVAIRPAQSTGPDRGRVGEMQTVHEEERDLGNLKSVRNRGDGIVRREVLREDASSDGEVVGTLRSAAKQTTTLTAENAMRVAQEIRRVDNIDGTPDARVIPVKGKTASDVVVKTTGDVEEARAGDTLDELLGDAVVARLPPVGDGPLGEGNDPHLTSSEKEERVRKAAEAAEDARQARISQSGKSATSVPVPAQTKAPVVEQVEQTLPEITAGIPGTAEVLAAQGIDDVETLRDVLRDPMAGAELAHALRAGPVMKLRKALGLA